MKANDEMSKKGWSGHIGSSPCIGWCHCTWTPFFSEDIYQIGNLPRDQHASNKVRNTRISAAIVSESFPNDFNLQLPMPWNMMKDLCVFMLYVLYCILCIILYIIFYILYILYFILYFLIFYCIYIYISPPKGLRRKHQPKTGKDWLPPFDHFLLMFVKCRVKRNHMSICRI